jgi:predicted nucleotidyltransferase component of viral defense system
VSWYSEYKKQWKEIIETVAAEEHRTPQMIEKDTIQSMILLELSQSSLPFVFKGGTSLSKTYGLIDRFSEDIDLSMSRKVTEAEKRQTKATIIEIADKMGLSLINPEDIQSKHSYNKYVYEYESLFSDIPLELIIETSFYQRVYPVENHKINSFVGQFCKERDIKLPIPFDAAEVEMSVQSLERTFIDKVFAVCDYRIQDMQDRDSRHLYDIAKLLTKVELTPELGELIDEVREDRMKSKNNPSAQLKYNIPDMLKEIISSRFYESDYNNITRRLLYEDVSYDEAIEKGIAIIAGVDTFEYRRNPK